MKRDRNISVLEWFTCLTILPSSKVSKLIEVRILKVICVFTSTLFSFHTCTLKEGYSDINRLSAMMALSKTADSSSL